MEGKVGSVGGRVRDGDGRVGWQSGSEMGVEDEGKGEGEYEAEMGWGKRGRDEMENRDWVRGTQTDRETDKKRHIDGQIKSTHPNRQITRKNKGETNEEDQREQNKRKRERYTQNLLPNPNP